MIRIRQDIKSRHALITLENPNRKMQLGIADGLKIVGSENKKTIKNLILRQPKTGIKYSNLPHRSSAPGEAPADQSGKLRRGVQYKANGWDSVEVGDTTEEGVYLEEGTRRMYPREHIERAARMKQRDNYNTLEEYASRGLINR